MKLPAGTTIMAGQPFAHSVNCAPGFHCLLLRSGEDRWAHDRAPIAIRIILGTRRRDRRAQQCERGGHEAKKAGTLMRHDPNVRTGAANRKTCDRFVVWVPRQGRVAKRP
jgi:hypothetical protein